MATIAKLNTTFTADGSGFVKTADKVAERSSRLSTDIGGAFSSLAKWAKVAAVAVAGFMSIQWARTVVNGAVETYKFARSIGVATNDIYALQQGLRDTGADAEKAGEILGNLSQNLSAAASGGAPAYASALAQIGLSAEQLARMPAPKALELIAEQFSKIESAEARAALASQLFGDNAKHILPLLTQGASGLKDAANKAIKVDDSKLAQIETVQMRFEDLQDILKQFALSVAQEVIPWVTAIADKLPSLGITAASVAEWMKGALATGGRFVAFLQDVYTALQIIGKGIQLTFATLVVGIVGTVRQGIKGINYLREKVGMDAIATDEIDAMFQGSKDVARGYIDEIGKLWDTMGKNPFADFLDGLEKSGNAIGKAADKARGANGALAALHKNGQRAQEAMRIKDEVLSPLERFNNKMAQLNAMLADQSLSWQEYARAAHGAVNELEKAHELQRMGFAAANQAGTVGAYSAALASKQQSDMSLRETAQERINRVLKESKEIEKNIQKNTEDTARALKNLQVVKA